MRRNILSTIGFCLLTTGWATAGVFNDWTYKRPITLSTATITNNYQVKVLLTTNTFNYAPCEAGGNDLRFEDASTLLNLPYWIESWNSSGTSTVWVAVANSGTTTFTLYYGKSGAAAASSGTNTFDFFDDFSGNLDKWTVRFKKNSGAAAIVGSGSSGYLGITGGQASADYGWTALGTVNYTNFLDGIIEGKVNLAASAIAEVGFRGNYTSVATGYKSRTDARVSEGLSLLKGTYNYPTWAQLGTPTKSGTAIGSGSWKPFKVTIAGSSFTLTCDGQTWSRTDSTTTTAGDISLQNHYGAGASYDDIRVRKYAATEPTATIGAEQLVATGVPIVNNSIGATNVWADSAWLNGVLVSTGTSDTVWGVLWGTNNPGTTRDGWLGGNGVNVGPAGGNNLTNTTQATGLAENTTYYYAYWATNAVGTNVAGATSFTTRGGPSVDNGTGASGIGIGTATLNGNLLATGGLATEVYVYWGPDTNNWANTNYLGSKSVGAFSVPVSNLYYGVRYYYRCYAVNAYAGRWTAASAEFLTLSPAGLATWPTGWSTNAWTGDATSGINSDYTYLVKVQPHAAAASVTINGVTFTGNGKTGPNHTISGIASDHGPNAPNVTGSSFNMAKYFSYGGTPGIVTVTNLIVGKRYLTTFYAYAFDTPGNRYQTFSVAGGPSCYVDQGFYGLGNGIRIAYAFDATASGNIFTITPYVTGSTFHMSGLSVAQDPATKPALSVTNTGSTAAAPGAAIFNATVQATGSVFDVWAYWGPTDGTNNPNAWLGSTLVTTLTNATSVNVSKTVAGLPPGTTFYTFRIINAATNFWASPSGSAVVEATADAPEIETGPVTQVNTNQASLNGFLTSTGTSATVVSVYWGSDGDRILTGDWAFTNDFGVCTALPFEGLAYATNATDLIPGQQYTYRYYAENATTGVWGDAVSFVTWITPTVDNGGGATVVGQTTATLNGTVLSGNPNPQAWIYWGTTDGGTDKGAWNRTTLDRGVQTGAFSGNASGLEANRSYYYRCYVSNECGEAWAPDSASFTTLAPGLSISDPSVTEGAEGSTTTLVFTVSLSAISTVDVTVDYATSNGTATVADNDYAATAGTLTIPAGSLTGLVSVMVNGNDVREADETLFINLANADRATLTDAQGLGTILNDDWSYYVRYGGPYGNGRGDSWSNAMGQISDAWNDLARGPQICSIYIEKTTGSQTYNGIRKTIGTWFLSPININHFGGLTPTDDAGGWTRQAGDTSHVKSTDPNLPGLRINSSDGVGGYYCAQFSMRFDDVMIEGGANEGAVAIVAAGYNSVASFAANRCTFSSGANNTNWPVVAVSPANNYPGETVAASRTELWLNRVLVRGHGKDQGGVRTFTGTGGHESGDSVMTLTNSVIVDAGAFGLYAKGNNYGTWNTDIDVSLCQVTIANVSNAVWFGDAANGVEGYNTLTMNRTLIYLNHPTMAVIRSFEIDAARATQVYGNDNAFFGYGTLTNGIDFIGLAGLGAHQVYDAGGNPQLHADGYHLTSASDRRLIDAYTGSGPTEDIDGHPRPLNQGAEIGAVEFVSPKGTLILVL